MAKQKYDAVGKIHRESLDKGFLQSLGVPFLSLMYEAMDLHSDSVLITKEINGEVIGFVSGTTNMRGLYFSMLKSPVRLMLALAPHAFSMLTIGRIFEILFLKKGAPEFVPPRAELLTIAVLANHRGSKTAIELYQNLCAFFAKRQVKNFHIVVGDQLERAHAFYHKMGATPRAKTTVHQGSESTIFIQEC